MSNQVSLRKAVFQDRDDIFFPGAMIQRQGNSPSVPNPSPILNIANGLRKF